MSRGIHLGLRGRLMVALVGVAVLAAALTTFFSTVNLESHVKSAAETRLARTATHFSEVASVLYREDGGWTPRPAICSGTSRWPTGSRSPSSTATGT